MEYPKGYSPLTEAQSARIVKAWTLYRETIGLEGDICHELVLEHKSQAEIDAAISAHREDRAAVIGDFRKEFGK